MAGPPNPLTAAERLKAANDAAKLLGAELRKERAARERELQSRISAPQPTTREE